jgi:tetratricopeptide (TPR) repeat protein
MSGERGAMSGRRAEIAVLLVVAIVRAVHLAGILGDPLAGIPRMDPAYHDAWARAIAAGDLTFDGPFFRAPLYAYFLGAVYAATGGSIAAARVAGLALGLGTAFLLMRIGRRTVGEKPGLLAGLAYGVYPIALRYEGDLLVEGLYILLAMAALRGQLRALERPARGRWFACGLLYGLAAITRPNILIVALAVPIVTALGRRLARAPVRARTALGEALVFAAGLVLPIAPVTLHNAIAGGDFVPIASQGGVNFYIGNNPVADGYTAIVPGTRATWWGGHDDAVALAEQARGRPLRASEVSQYWTAQGLAFLRAEPAAALRLYVRKLYLFWWGAEISNNEHIYFLRRYSPPMQATLWHAGLYFPFGLVGPLALLGMALGWARLRARVLPLVAYVVLYMISVVLFFVCARFRLPVVPVLLLFAAYAALALPALVLPARGARRPLRLLALGVVLLVAVNADLYRLDRAVFGAQALSYLDLGIFHAREKDFAAAEVNLRKAAELDPGLPAPHAWLGRLALERRDFTTAEAELRLATRGDPVLFRDVVTQAERDLGRLALMNGWYDRALAVYTRALELDPGLADAAAGAGVAALALGDTAAARAHLTRALAIDPENRKAHAAWAELGARAARRP